MLAVDYFAQGAFSIAFSVTIDERCLSVRPRLHVLSV